MVTEELALKCRGLTKRFGETVALDGLDIDLPRGEILALLGASGCGKTTALRVIAGFEAPDSGSVEIGGRRVAAAGVNLPPEKRRVGLVFQDYALFPHMTVEKNIAYGLRRGAARERLSYLTELVGLKGLETRMPHQLSGGQQQRVALARTLASEPDVLLLDEPFSNLDARLRVQVREDVHRLIQETGATAVFVTHDQEEAFVLADRIIVMNAGRSEQVGTASDLYFNPATPFVARFVGIANFLPASVTGESVTCELGSFPSNRDLGSDIRVMLRPEDVVLGEGSCEVEIVGREFHGPFVLYRLRLESGREMTVRRGAGPMFDIGQKIAASLRNTCPVVFDFGRVTSNQ